MIPQGSYLEVENDFQFHYYDEGDGDVVVLLHGSGTGASGHTNFKNNFIALKEAGYRVILPDLPGYGFSSKPEDETYSLDYFNSKILQFLDALKVPGGVEDQDTYNKMPGIQKLLADFLGGEMNQEKIEGLLSLFPYDSSIISDEMVSDRMEILPLMNSQVLASMTIPNMEKDLSRIPHPILAFWGINDQFIPVSGSMKIGEKCPNAQIMLFSQCGHWVMIEKEQIFNEACINFLSA